MPKFSGSNYLNEKMNWFMFSMVCKNQSVGKITHLKSLLAVVNLSPTTTALLDYTELHRDSAHCVAVQQQIYSFTALILSYLAVALFSETCSAPNGQTSEMETSW